MHLRHWVRFYNDYLIFREAAAKAAFLISIPRLHRLDMADSAGCDVRRVRLVGVDMHVKPEMRIDPYEHVAEHQLPLAFDPHPDLEFVAQAEFKRVLR